MSVLVDEGFDGQPLGPFSGGTVISGGINPTPNHSYQNAVVFGGLAYDLGLNTDLSIFMSFRGGATSIFVLGFKNLFNQVFNILNLTKEQDGSLSAIGFVNSSKIANSMTQNKFSFATEDWVFIHTHMVITPGTPSSAATVNVKVNELDWLSGTVTGLPANLFCNYFSFDGSLFAEATLDNLTIKSSDDSLPHPADDPPGTPPYPHIFGRMTHDPVEYVSLPNDTTIRMSEMFAEDIELPNDQRVRCSEIIIEIIQSQGVSGGGWVVKEA